MDFAQFGVEMTREQEIISTKKRLETFQFRRTSGPTAPAPLSPASSAGRAHSRHGSVSSTSLSGSISTNSFSTTADQPTIPSSDSRPSSFVGRPRPTSHHRRRSSVSTRAESAEMMGISVPDLPPSSSDDNINFGDKDSVRRRALQALEGRKDLGFCSTTVEIPEFTVQGIPQKPFDREFKLPSNAPTFGIPPFAGKRDSFGKFLSSGSSLKDQLHTLMEEEEEDEELQSKGEITEHTARDTEAASGREEKAAIPDNIPFDVSDGSIVADAKAYETSNTHPTLVASRHRPANLTLRPLSLISSTSNPCLPTPSLTTNPRVGLRSFSLVPHIDTHLNSASDSSDVRWSSQVREQNDIHSNSSSFSSSTSADQTSSGGAPSVSQNPKRQCSISYIRSGTSQSQATTFTMASLPTPGPTPTSERRQSASSVSSFGSVSNQDRRNASEDMFLHQSHASLLARITELEHALQSRSRSAPMSGTSEGSVAAADTPHDEMLQLVADLKAERDDLNKDIEGWRQRVKGLEHSRALLGHEKIVLERRLEAERREGWLKDEKLGLLEMEKATLNRQLTIKEEEISSINRRLESTQDQLRQARLECESLREDAEVAKRQLGEAHQLLEARKETDMELIRLREALTAEQIYGTKVTSRLDDAETLNTPKMTNKSAGRPFVHAPSNEQPRNNGFGFRSIDSACTTVDADEESHQALRALFTLKAVEEESEIHRESISDDEDELARYEDEDDLDITSPVRSPSSQGSDDDLPRSLSHLRIAANNTPVPSNGNAMLSARSPSSTPSPTSSPCPTPIPLAVEMKDSGHASRASLSRTWTFPRGGQGLSSHPPAQDVDRFFGCLEDIEDSPAVVSYTSMDDRNAFSQRLCFEDGADEDLPPFVLPIQKVSADTGCTLLDVVLEEDEDDLQCEIPDERRKRSFPVSVSEDSLSRMSSPLLEDSPHTNSVPFIFPQMRVQVNECNRDTTSPSSGSRERECSKPVTSPTAVSVRLSTVSPAKITRSHSAPPSRIPPPSPPKFFQAKSTAACATPSPPSRKSVMARGVSPASPSRLKPLGAAVVSPKGSKTIQLSAHNPSFIPHLKITSSSESQESAVGAASSSVTSAMKHKDDGFPTHEESNSIFTRSSKPLLPAITNLIPLPSLPWGRNRLQNSVVAKRDPVYVPKERQLAKLRASMTMRRECTSQRMEITRCNKCRGDLMSL